MGGGMTMKKAATASDVLRVAFCHFTADVCGGSDFSLFNIVKGLPRDRFLPLVILKTGDPMAHKFRELDIEVFETALIPPRLALDVGNLVRYGVSFGLPWRASPGPSGGFRRTLFIATRCIICKARLPRP